MEGKHTVIPSSALRYGEQQLDAHGAFGVVFRGTYNGRDVAIKKTRLQGESEYFVLSSWADEVRKLERFDDINIARFLGVVEEKGNMALVQEWIEGHDLAQALKSYPEGAPNDFAGRIGRQIAEGLSYLHVNNIVHLNLSPGNVILTSRDNTVKLRDYGLRTFKFANFATANYHGNPRYAAVEVVMREHNSITTAADVWSWAFVMWEILTGQVPFKAYHPPQVSRKIWEAGDRPDLDDVKDKNITRVLARAWDKSPSARPTVQELIRAAQELQGAAGGNSGAARSQPAAQQQRAAAPAKSTDASIDDMLADLDKML